MTISKQQIPLEVCVPRWCNGNAPTYTPNGSKFESLTERCNFEVSKVLYDISKLLALFRTRKANLVCVFNNWKNINYHKKVSATRVEA